MRTSIDDFRRKFPHLAKELLEGESEGVVVRVEEEAVADDPWRGYTPGPVDYIRRCKTVEEAIEVIDYLETRGEISSEEASNYRSILRERGLEYFGPRKVDDYYYKKAYEYWRKRALREEGAD